MRKILLFKFLTSIFKCNDIDILPKKNVPLNLNRIHASSRSNEFPLRVWRYETRKKEIMYINYDYVTVAILRQDIFIRDNLEENENDPLIELIFKTTKHEQQKFIENELEKMNEFGLVYMENEIKEKISEICKDAENVLDSELNLEYKND